MNETLNEMNEIKEMNQTLMNKNPKVFVVAEID